MRMAYRNIMERNVEQKVDCIDGNQRELHESEIGAMYSR